MIKKTKQNKKKKTTQKKSVRYIFSNHFGISGLPETWIKAGELYEAILCFPTFNILKQVPI